MDESDQGCSLRFIQYDQPDKQGDLDRPVANTCTWIHEQEPFASWLSYNGSHSLWLTGHAGSGKSILSSYIFSYLVNDQTIEEDHTVLAYFCDNRTSIQTDAIHIVACLIYQLIYSHRSLLRIASADYKLLQEGLFTSFDRLWNLLTKTIQRKKTVGDLYIIIDALDECEPSSCEKLLQAIGQMQSHQNIKEGRPEIRFLLTSRPQLRDSILANNVASTLQEFIHINSNLPGYIDGLRVYIEHSIQQISKAKHFSDKAKEFLLETLTSRSDTTYLWVGFVLKDIPKTKTYSNTRFKKDYIYNTVKSTVPIPSVLRRNHHRRTRCNFTFTATPRNDTNPIFKRIKYCIHYYVIT